VNPLTKQVDAFADPKRRNRAILDLVGAINASDLRRVRVKPEARTALISGLDHPKAKVRWWCLQLMDHLADESYLEPMLTKLSDPVAKVRPPCHPRPQLRRVQAKPAAACHPHRGGATSGT
jgi:hypothetical protein